MWNGIAREGVCSACRLASECLHAAAARRPILNCGQFELAVAAPPLSTELTVPRASAGEDRPRRLKGLCSNCEFRDTCIYPKPEGGVWRCEEYR